MQSTNGTASNSTAFRPQGYETGEDTTKDAVVGKGVLTLVNNATWLMLDGHILDNVLLWRHDFLDGEKDSISD